MKFLTPISYYVLCGTMSNTELKKKFLVTLKYEKHIENVF